MNTGNIQVMSEGSCTPPEENVIYQQDEVYVMKNADFPNGIQEAENQCMEDEDEYLDHDPFIEILEQPQARGFRFRYECEGPSHGGLQGEKSQKYKRTYPAIKINGYSGPARVVVTIVTDEDIPRPHAHKLVGKNCVDGNCIVELKGGNSTVSFSNLCVQHVTRKKASEVIEARIVESIKLDKLVKLGNLNAKVELSDEEMKNARANAEKQAKDMQLNVVKLCFQAYLRDVNGQFNRLLPSVLSSPIYDSKSPGANALKICRMDKYGGCCTGGDEVFLLCEKVQKEDIQVRFIETNEEGEIIWEDCGIFGPFDVHRQYAIVFKTPPYRVQNIDRAVNVLIMLQRKTDNENSDPKSFTYYPQNNDKDEINRKKSKRLPAYSSSFGDIGSGAGMGMNNGFPNNDGSGFPPVGGNLPITVNENDVDLTVQQNRHTTLPTNNPTPINKPKGRGRGRPRKNPLPPSDLDTDSGPASLPKQAIKEDSRNALKQKLVRSARESAGITVNSYPVAVVTTAPNLQFVQQPVFQQTVPQQQPNQFVFNPQPQISQQISQQIPFKQPNLIQQQQTYLQQHVHTGQNYMTPQGVSIPKYDFPSSYVMANNQYLQPHGSMNNIGINNNLLERSATGGQANLSDVSRDSSSSNEASPDDLCPDKDALTMDQADCCYPGVHNDLDRGHTRQDSFTSSENDKLEKDVSDRHTRLESLSLEGDSLTFSGDLEEDGGPILSANYLNKLKTCVPVPELSIQDKNVKNILTACQTKKQEISEWTKNEVKNEVRCFSAPLPGGGKQDVLVQTDKDNTMVVAERTATAMQFYAATGDIRKLLLVQRYLTLVADDNGDLPLHTCIINKQLEVVHNLLDVMETLPEGYRKMNAHNRLLQTPLHLAVMTNQPGTVELLIKAGAQPSIVDKHGNTAMHLAVIHSAIECLTVLLKYTRPWVTKNKPFPELDCKNFEGLTPMHIAADKNNIKAIKLLVHGKADVNIPDGKCGRTALHFASISQDLSIAGCLLLEARAEVNAVCFDGNTPLHLACGKKNVGMVALLMAAGADPNMENADLTDTDSNCDGEESKKDRSEEDCSMSLRGQLPKDFAAGHEKILKILNGNMYTSMQEIHEETDNREYERTTSMLTSLTLASGRRSESGLGNMFSKVGDMDQVTYPLRLQLSNLLDPPTSGRDWLALADILGFSDILTVERAGNSPTRMLLTYYEECGGTVQRLVEALASIQRPDVIEVIRTFLSHCQDSGKEKVAGLDGSLSHMDSGVDSPSLHIKQSKYQMTSIS